MECGENGQWGVDGGQRSVILLTLTYFDSSLAKRVVENGLNEAMGRLVHFLFT